VTRFSSPFCWSTLRAASSRAKVAALRSSRALTSTPPKSACVLERIKRPFLQLDAALVPQ